MADFLSARLSEVTRSITLVLAALIVMSPAVAAAYSSNDPEAVVKLYAPDAILPGTVSPVISAGTEAIRKYFSMIKGSGNRNAIQERHTIVLGDSAVVVTKSGDEWRIAHHHSSPRVPPKQ